MERKRPSHNLATIDFHREIGENGESIPTGFAVPESDRDLKAKLRECSYGLPAQGSFIVSFDLILIASSIRSSRGVDESVFLRGVLSPILMSRCLSASVRDLFLHIAFRLCKTGGSFRKLHGFPDSAKPVEVQEGSPNLREHHFDVLEDQVIDRNQEQCDEGGKEDSESQ